MLINITVTVIWGYHRAKLCPYAGNAMQNTQHYWFRDPSEIISGGVGEYVVGEQKKKRPPLLQKLPQIIF